MSEELIDEMIAVLRLYESTYVRAQRHPTVSEEAFVMAKVSSILKKVDKESE